MRMSGTYDGNMHGGTRGYTWLCLCECYSNRRKAGTPADGGRADTPAGGGQAGTMLRMTDGHAYMFALWGKGGHGGSPNVEAGKMYQQVGGLYATLSSK